MKLKKGFTLIEIIAAIALIALIGTASFVGVKYALDSNKITSLSQVEDEILNALKIYLETDSVASKQLYGEENAVITPIKLLINKGLLDLSNTDISEEDIEKNYVVTAFMSNVTDDYKCTEAKDLRTITSWDESLSQPLYICTNFLVEEKEDDYEEIREYIESNTSLEIPSNERYYLDPMYNYVKYEKDGVTYNYRMLYVDVDNTYVLVNKGSFGSVFDGYSEAISVLPNLGCKGSSSSSKCIYVQTSNQCGCWPTSGGCCGYYEELVYNSYNISNKNIVNGETNIDLSDIKEAVEKGAYTDYRFTQQSHDSSYYLYDGKYMDGIFPNINNSSSAIKYSDLSKFFKIRLKSCLGIDGGTGRLENPFVLKPKCEEGN